MRVDSAKGICSLIAIFLPSLRRGGAERIQLYLARRFAEKGEEVELVVANLDGAKYQSIPNDVAIVDLKAKRVSSSLPALVRYLRERKPSSVLSALDHCNLVALCAVKLARVRPRLLISVHSPISKSSRDSGLRDRAIPHFARILYRWADEIIAVSSGVADDLSKTISLPRDRIRVIHNPVVVPELFELAKEPVDHLWLQQSKPPTILAVGRLEPSKDYPTLLRALARVLGELSVQLIVLGEGGERSKLEGLIQELSLKEHVDLYGFAENPFAFMSKARLLVLPSTFEGFGNVIVEALALNLPVVSTNCPTGPAEILEQGRFGRLVPVGDESALADAILNELSSPVEGVNRRDRAMDFTYERIADQYLDLITKGATA